MKNVPDHLSILVIEDNPTDLYLLEEMLHSSGTKIKNIFTADRTSLAYEILEKHKISLILLDLSLPDSFGIESFLKIKDVTQKIPVIILTGLTDSEVALEAIKQGAQDYLVKGEFKADVLVRSIQYSIERKNTEEKILASEERYRQMFYKNPFPAWIYDLDSLHVLEVNDAAIKQYGYERNEFLNLTIKDIRPAEDIHETMHSLSLRGVPEKLKGKICRHKKKNGEIILVEVTFYKIDYSGKIAMQVQINDVTERFRLEKELAEQQKIKQLHITEAVLTAQEKERKGIGEELHDNINQILATSKLFLSTALQESSFEFIAKSQEYVSLAMEEIRKLSKALITPAFIRSGLEQSIEQLIDNTMAAKKISITTDIKIPEETNVEEGLKLAIYRIIQEQLNNILKYADASAISIRIDTDANIISLSISDNGKGFDVNQKREGIGITNITNRAELYNGNVKIDSSPGNGCRLRVELHTKNILPQKAA
jgi:two-component system, NarL family, sensor histidine kinase UhpB